MPNDFKPNFTATGIGTLPHTDAAAAVGDVLSRLAGMPYWPQLPALGPQEDMNHQYAPALEPLVKSDLDKGELVAFSGQPREEALAAFYERLMAGDTASFGLRTQEAAGFPVFMEQVAAAPAGSYPWVKGHVTGPLTFAASVMGADGKAMLYDDEVAEALARGLGAAAAAQVNQLGPLGRPVMVFLDEPFLSGFGSAFTPVSREKAVGLLAASLEELRNRATAVAGIHCCGNTDWSVLIEAGADVINLDSAGFGEHLLLYPQAVGELFARGGAVAWGAVPTSEFTGQETGPGLWAGLKGLLEGLEAKGLDRGLIASQALVTPACGMGTLDKEKALRILDLTAEVSELARKEYA